MTTTMRRVLLVVAAAALAILITAFVLDAITAGTPSAAPETAQPVRTTAPPTTESPATGATTGSSGDDGAASEVLPPSTPTTGLPPSEPYEPLVALPLPAAGSSNGTLVAGFPATIPVHDGSSIVTSSLAVQDDTLQAALDAEVDADPTTVLDFYTSALGERGMVASPSPATGGSRALVFARDTDSLVITVTPDGDGTRYSIFGVFRPTKPAEG